MLSYVSCMKADLCRSFFKEIKVKKNNTKGLKAGQPNAFINSILNFHQGRLTVFLFHKHDMKNGKKFGFPLEVPVIHKANDIYERTCTCKTFYIAETKRNSELQWNEHCSLRKPLKQGIIYQ